MTSPEMPTPVVGTPLPQGERAEYVVSCLRDYSGVVENDTTVILLDCPLIPLYSKTTGAIIGYETYVRLFDETGDLGVDAHRQFINPPDGRVKLDDGSIIETADPIALVEDILRQTVTP